MRSGVVGAIDKGAPSVELARERQLNSVRWVRRSSNVVLTTTAILTVAAVIFSFIDGLSSDDQRFPKPLHSQVSDVLQDLVILLGFLMVVTAAGLFLRLVADRFYFDALTWVDPPPYPAPNEPRPEGDQSVLLGPPNRAHPVVDDSAWRPIDGSDADLARRTPRPS